MKLERKRTNIRVGEGHFTKLKECKQNNSGFTLIEIIGVVIILGILAIIAVPYITKNMENFRDDYYVNIENTLLSSGQEFYTDNRKYVPTKFLGSSKVSINTLESENYIDEVLDYEGNSCNKDSYVIIIKKSKTEYDYHLCLVCEGDDYDNTDKNECDSSWASNDTLTVELGDPPVAYIYKGSTRDEVREKLKISADIVRYNNKGEEIARVNGKGEEGIPEILPSNIDTIDTSKVGEYDTIYEYQGVAKKGKAIVYENDSPYIKMTQVNKVRKDSATSGLQEERDDYSGTGEWAQKLVIEFGEGDSEDVKYDESSTTVSRYQWKRGERWLDFCIPSSGNSCTREITEEMNETVYFRALDNEGNISRESGPYIIRIDNTAPLCELALTGNLGENDWYVGDTTVSFGKALDQTGSNASAVSGIKTKGITLGPIGTNQTGVQTIDTSGVTWYGVIEDNAKNSTVCKVTFKKDATKPECTLNLSGTVGDNSWYTSNVVVAFSKNTDAMSGVAQYGIGSLTGSKTLTHSTDTASVTYTGQIKDNAGNTATCPITFKKDGTKPECALKLTGTVGSNSWYTSNVVVAFSKNTDAMSGVAQYGISSLTGSKTVTHTADTTSVTYTGQIKDNAGNTATCPVTFKKDGTPPTVSWNLPGGTYDDSNGKTISGVCSDAISGTTSKVEQHVSSPTSSTTVSVTCVDGAGNSLSYSQTYSVRYYYSNNCDKCGARSCTSSSCCGRDTSCSTNYVCYDPNIDSYCGEQCGSSCSYCSSSGTCNCRSYPRTCTSSCCGCNSCYAY